MTLKEAARYVVTAGVNVAFFYGLITWLNRSIEWEKVATAFHQIPPSAIAVSLGLSLLGQYFYGKRLALLLNRPESTGFWVSVYGFGANNVLPFRLGDLLKLYYAKKYFRISTTKLVFVKVAEKLLDLGCLFIIGGAAFLAGGFFIDPRYLRILACLLIGTILVAACVCHAIRRRIGLTVWITAHRRTNHFYKKFLEIAHNPDVIPACKATLAIWVLTTLTFYGFFRCGLPDAGVTYVDALALTFITALSLGIPATPGAVGIFEAVIVFYLIKSLNVSTEVALASALLLHVVTAIPQILLMGLAVLKVRFRPLPDRTCRQSG